MNGDRKNSEYLTQEEILNLPSPKVLINVCTHGNETIGLEVVKKIQKIAIKNGSITFNVANEEAVNRNTRYIESDLNRSFPGNPKGNHEERIAHELMHYIPHFDYLIDIHSTVSGMTDCLIIEDDSEEVQTMISACHHAATVLHMNATKGASIFTATRLPDKTIPAIAFEYGDNSQHTIEKTSFDIISILSYLGILDNQNLVINTKEKGQFDCYALYKKELTDTVNPEIQNYILVRKGDVVGYTKDNIPIFAGEDFYPVLFGEKHYKDIFGFKAKKLS